MRNRNPRAILAASLILMAFSSNAFSQDDEVDFGQDTSEFANDYECDDPRFAGLGMATSIAEENILSDATDCRRLYTLGAIYLIDEERARAVTRCDAIGFGDDSSEWATNGICDDIRFDGPGVDPILNLEDIGRDATDCRRACDAGEAFLRDHLVWD